MLETYIKYFFIILYSFLIYFKLLNIKRFSKINILSYFLISLFMSSILTMIRSYSFFFKFTTIMMIILFFLFITLITKSKLSTTITPSIAAVGISNAVFVLSVLIVALTSYFLGLSTVMNQISFYLMAFSIMLEFVILYLIFKFKRFRKGMPFLQNSSSKNIVIFISIFILFCISILINNDKNHLYMIPTALVVFSCISLILWWYRHLTEIYLERKKNTDLQELLDLIREKDNEINMLKHQNENFASLIHRDNKIIPALELSVRNYIKLSMENNSDTFEDNGHLILNDLNRITQERYGIINTIKKTAKQLPHSTVFSLDSLMNYYLQKSISQNVEFDLSLLGNINYFIQQFIQENDLNTLIADLVENAFNSVKDCNEKRVLINIRINTDYYIIDVFDSGNIFDIDVLLNLGIHRRTTNIESDCHGIGLMTLYGFSKKYKFSIIIEEFRPNIKLYSKQISLSFDNNNDYIVKTYRASEFPPSLRMDMTIIDTSINNFI